MGRKKKYHTEEERLEAKKKSNRERYLKNKEKNKKERELNSQQIAKYQKEYRKNNKEILLEKRKVYYEENKEKFLEYQKEYRETNKDEIRERKNKYQRNKRNSDPIFKLRGNISSLIRYGITNNGFTKTNKTEDILGCSFEEFKEHIESKWEDWMTWDNYGNPKDGIIEENKTWDIDHIVPISSAINENEVIKLNHFTNLQPLCSYENRFIKNDNKA